MYHNGTKKMKGGDVLSATVFGNPNYLSIVCVDSYENGVMSGRIYNPCVNGGLQFCGVIEFLKKVESIMEETKFPQSFSENRVFRPVQETDTIAPPQTESRNGNTATFALKVLFRQNASWQGSVSWLEGKQEESFRSVLELLMLLDSALTSTK